MPHIVLNQHVDLLEFSKFFVPYFQKSPLIRISSIYVENNGFTALLHVVVIDELHQEFFIRISTSLKKTTIRLLPLTDPEKTDSVKKSLSLVYLQMKKFDSSLVVTKSNLWEYIEEEVVQ
ncbi:MAG: hypothetical protein ACW9XH_06090 [Candidatus Nitrosopumilus sp. bin_32a]|jgi:hypothetical protein